MNATNRRVEIDELVEIVEANWIIKFKSNMAKAAEEVHRTEEDDLMRIVKWQ